MNPVDTKSPVFSFVKVIVLIKSYLDVRQMEARLEGLHNPRPDRALPLQQEPASLSDRLHGAVPGVVGLVVPGHLQGAGVHFAQDDVPRVLVSEESRHLLEQLDPTS